MSRRTIFIIFLVLACLTLSVIILKISDFSHLMNEIWLDIIYAAILAIILVLIINYLYDKFYDKSKFNDTTRIVKPRKMIATLILPDNQFIKISEYVRIVGREDFVGTLIPDKLVFIGKEHFKLSLLDDGFYIEDMDSKNGTEVNNKEIKGLGKIKLKNDDIINVAHIIEINFKEE